MVSVENFHHGTGGRGHHDVAGRFHRDPVADGFAGEGFVRHLLEGHHVTGNRRNQRLNGLRVRYRLRFSRGRCGGDVASRVRLPLPLPGRG